MASQGAPDEARSPAPTDAEAPGAVNRVHTRAHVGLPKFRFLEEIRKRNVGRVAVLYVVVSWLILEPVHVIFHMLEVPLWANRLVIILLALGFPAAMIFAWVYEITPEGLKPTVEVPHGQSIRRQTGRRLDRAIIAVLALAVIYFVLDKFWLSNISGRGQHGAAATTIAAAPAAQAEPAAAFVPPAHSIAVLPFVNMSGDSQQDYFSDGLSEELLNSLSRITALQVAARTSSFSFKGKQVDIADIAHKLNVGAILEGSVRKVGARVRITAQLINAVTGFHLWSQTYDRDLSDILALQTEIASAVTTALQATLLGNVSALIELGGTQNALAFDAYLRGQRFVDTARDKEARSAEVAAYSEAVRLDPRYAKAYVGLSLALIGFASNAANGPAIRETYKEARAAAERALALAPELGEAHAAFAAVVDVGFTDYPRAAAEYERALALSPGNALVLRMSALFLSRMGRAEAAFTYAQRAVVLDPLNVSSHRALGDVLYEARRYPESIEAFNRALTLNPQAGAAPTGRGLAQLALGEFEAARASCATPPLDWYNSFCLAIVYHKLNRQSDADAALAAVRAEFGDDASFQYAEIYAQWGNIPTALEWLETAYRVHDTGLVELKVDPMLDPLRQEPRFKAIERKFTFPT